MIQTGVTLELTGYKGDSIKRLILVEEVRDLSIQPLKSGEGPTLPPRRPEDVLMVRGQKLGNGPPSYRTYHLRYCQNVNIIA